MTNFFAPGAALRTTLTAVGIFFTLGLFSQEQPIPQWTVAPFDNRVFIENKGQFDHNTNDPSIPVLFQSRVEGLETYFTAKGICWRHDDVVLLNEQGRDSMIALNPFYSKKTAESEEEKENENERYHFSKSMPRYLVMEWLGANPNPTVERVGMVSNYFTYPKDKSVNSATIIANAWEKIIYKEMYPGIDIEYIIPKDKDGIKYSLLLHPGADLSQVKMKYTYEKGVSINNEGNVIIESLFGDFTDHAPVSFYEGSNQPVVSSFVVNDDVVSFKADYNNSQALVVDPWTTSPGFPTWNRAYDVNYDKNGNVYAYGGAYPWQLAKFSPAGAILWTYSATGMYNSGCCTGSCYGDMAVDETSGSCYLSEGFDWTTGSRVFKVNTNGVQVSASAGNPNFNEIWRMEYNRCINVIVGSGGGTSCCYQAIVIDTTFTTMTPVNVYGTGPGTDNWGMTIDPTAPFVYLSTTGSSPNPMIKCPIPALLPVVWNTNSGFSFTEIGSVTYATNGCCANGFNGMSASLNWLYGYNGTSLKKYNKATGATITTIATGGTMYASGGTTSDICDNVYVGVGNVIKEYNSSLTQISTIATAGTTYDCKLGPNNGKIYASGDGFVSQLTVPINTVVLTHTHTNSSNCTCNGTATENMTICGSPATGVSYSWSPGGQTTQTATGLCAGLYTVTITSACNTTYQDTVNISVGNSTITSVNAQTNVLCNGSCTGTASVTPSGGTAPYTYTWTTAPVQYTSTATGLCAGTYTVTIKDNLGCILTQIFTITQPPALTATTTQVNVLCNGSCTGTATVTAGGGVPGYTYTWNTTPTQSTVTATGLCASSYTVTVKDANGCTRTATVTITQPPALTLGTTQVNLLCNGVCNGTATAAAAGGTPGYTYSWNTTPVQTTATATGLCAGSYTVTATDANGCTRTATVTITQPTALTATTTQVNASCNGSCNGTSTVTAGGGFAPYSYSWNTTPVQTTATATGLCAGNYTVTVTDANGCTRTATITITQPTLLNASTTSTQSTCSAANGTATVTASGGTGPYSYSWNTTPVQTTSTATGLTAGSYTVTVTDANGCTRTATVIISSAAGGTASISASTNVSCNGGNNGSATVTMTGGTGPFVYSWNTTPVQTTSTATGLTAGSYTVTVTDANGCIATATVTITQPPALTASTTQVNVLCNGSCTGTATVTAGGGTPGYTYTWSTAPTQSTVTATGLCAGSYTVTVKDANGCTITSTVTITQPPALTATTTQVNVTCNGQCNGTSTVTAGGGTGPYTYSWNTTPSQSTATATGLCAGSYTVTVTDANGCTRTANITITQPTALTATTSSTQSTCSAANGSATVNASGGTPGYSYSWNTTPVQTTSTATGIAAGNYTVVVTDLNGCTFTATVTVNSAAGGTASISASTNVSCFGGSNGSATVTMTGGTGPFTYSWNTTPVQTTSTATGLSAGSYTVTVTDANGCITSANVTITQPTLLTSSTTQVNVLCNGSCTGTATVTGSGGTPGYTYTWSTAPTQSTVTATGLCAGSYTVTVKDANGCTSQSTVTITQPPALNLVMTQVNVLCNGVCSGTATITVTGGVAPYTYAWNTTPAQTNATATGLCAGSYTVTVTDFNGCTATSTVTITQPTALVLNTTQVNAICGQPNGTATVNASGGTPNYSYSWNSSPIQLTPTATGLAAGNYTVTVTDLNGCTATAAVTIINMGSPTVTITGSTNVTCFNFANGTITSNTTGGTGPYIYSWAPSGGNGPNATGLGPNTYTITVTDANGCSSQASVTITQPTLLTSSIPNSVNVLCFGGNNGSATVLANGGTPNYTYSWSTTPAQTTTTATGLTAGSYTVTVTDANGCTTTSSVTITEPTQLTLAVAGFNATCSGACNGQGVCIPSGGVGPYQFSWAPSGGTNPSATGLCAGIYTVFVMDANGCTANDTAIVNQPLTVTATTTQVDVLCNGSCTGTATVTPNGGTTPYTVSWNTIPAQTTLTATGLCAGNYTCVVTDANNCTTSVVVTITQPSALTATTTQVNILCNGSCNGTATVNASGGVAPYTYSWSTSPSQSAATATGLCAGNYSVTITDANGCTLVVPFVITQPPVLTITGSAAPSVICIGQPSTLTGTAGGGNPNYTISWMPGGMIGSTTVVSPTATTTYTVFVTDANGCTDTNTVTVTVNPLPVVTFTSNPTPAVGCAPLCVDFINTTPNSVNCSWNFFPGSSNICNPTFCYTSPGTYDVELTVTDNNGCSNSLMAPAYVTVWPNPVADFTMSPQPTTILNGLIQFTDLSQGNPNTWTWSFGDVLNSGSNLQNPTFTYTDSGYYTVTLFVTNQYGCVDSVQKTLRIDPDFAIYVPNAFTPDGTGPNETFFPQGVGIDENCFKMWIFDRWGNMIWFTEKWGNGWDGHANGGAEVAQEDVYVWKIEVCDFTGAKHKYIGHVSLIK